jgi:hypothetical protein
MDCGAYRVVVAKIVTKVLNVRVIKSRRARSMNGAKRNAYRILVGNPEGKRRRWVDNIKMDLRERVP